MDLNSPICRACLLPDSTVYSFQQVALFRKEYTFLEMFNACTHLEALEEDDLPQFICQSCSNDLQNAFDFLLRATASDQFLKTQPQMKQEAEFFMLSDENHLEEEDKSIEFEENTEIEHQEEEEEIQNQHNEDVQETFVEAVKSEFVNSESINHKHGFDTQFEQFVEEELASENIYIESNEISNHESDAEVNISEHDEEMEETLLKHDVPQANSMRKAFRESKNSTAKSNQSVECHNCGKILKEMSVRHHLKRCLKEEKVHLCSSCPKSFAVLADLKNHMRRHDTERERKYVCTECGRGFFEKQALQVHMTRHMGVKEYHCKICPKKFTTKKSLDVHEFTHNRDLGRFTCKYCSKRFTSKADLVVHERFHTGDYPFQCEFCDKSYAVKSHLNYHLAKHKGITYKCDQCDKEFINRGSLTAHKFKHSDRMPHECSICKKGFTSPFKNKMFDSLPICRVCLKTSLEYIDFDTPFELDASIKAVVDNGLTYLDCFQACTRIEIEFDENYPQSLCSSCGLELKIAFEFLQKAESADKTLRELSANTKVEKFDDDEIKCFLQPEMLQHNDEESSSRTDKHEESHLDDEKTYVCTVCGEQFFSQMVLNLHVNRLHTNNTSEEHNSTVVEKVECQICDVILSVHNLEAHMQMHEEESNFEENNEDKTVYEEVVVDEPDEVEFEMLDMTNVSVEEEDVRNISDSQDAASASENYEAVDDDEEEILSQVKNETTRSDADGDAENEEEGGEADADVDEDEDDAKFNVIAKMITEQEKQKHRSKKGKYQQCEICSKNVRTSSFTAHMNVHNGVKQFPCEYCFQSYFSNRSLQKHVKANHADSLNSCCKICNETVEGHDMKAHIEEKHSHVVKCTECDHSCAESKMKDHVKRKHTESKDFLCNVCSKTFSTLGVLNGHLKYHDKQFTSSIKSDACHICGKVFSSNHYMKKHLITHQENRNLLKCDYCDKTYHTKHSLFNHMRIHTGDTIKCVMCDKEFGRQYELNVHMRFHTKEYPFECEMCHKKFAIKGHLRTHMWRHQGLKLQCEECGKLFTSTKALAEHSFYHSEMPYQCPYCPKAYPSKPKFKVHLKTAHMVEFSNEELQRMVKFPIPKRPRNRKFTLVQADTVIKEVEVHTKFEID
ncbi:zinc finger protein 62 homolog [Episyrphus balteatus]|uniref:zinc finger protein 62 homolog n=1 Tax=Episyrphus balteatus TaxID=286459 RepID=UPI00248504C1|nr:zinc finger protein 62 homolog [Episyrphus balteatus]